MKRNFTTLLLVLIVVFNSKASLNSSTLNWCLSGGGSKVENPVSVVTDQSGNIYVAYSFQASSTFNGVTLTGTSALGTPTPLYSNNMCLTKMNPNKTHVWNIRSNIGVVSPNSTAIAPNGDIILTGTCYAQKLASTTTANIIDALDNSVTFSGLGVGTGYSRSFVARYSSNGANIWTREFKATATKDSTVITNVVTTDANGDIYVTGTFVSSLLVPGNSTPYVNQNTTQSLFVSKLNGSTGDEIWTKTTSGGLDSESFTALAVEPQTGSIFAAGTFKTKASTTSVNVSGTSLSINIPSIYCLTIMKLSSAGTISYLKSRQNDNDIRVKDIAFATDTFFVAGSYRDAGGIQFGSNSLTITGKYLNSFIAAFKSSDCSDVWQNKIVSPGIVEIYDIEVGTDRNVYSFGTFYNGVGTGTVGDVDFGNNKIITDATNKSGDVFQTTYNQKTGLAQEVKTIAKGTGSDNAVSMCRYGNNFYLLGKYNSSELTLENSTTLATAGGFDFFLANYIYTATALVSPQKDVKAGAYDKSQNKILIFNPEQYFSIRLFDISGKVLLSQKSERIDAIDTNHLSSGVYVLQLTNKSGVVSTQRFVIQ